MFTGIIQEIGTLKKKTKKNGEEFHFEIASKKLKLILGASISVNGVCLTVTQKTKDGFGVDMVPETQNRTNLGKLSLGAKINLEPSIKVGDRLDGHFVAGHVDTIAKILKRGKIQHGVGLVLELPKKLVPFIAEKGSVALNGVSLTVTNVEKKSFTVALIPFTQKYTNLGKLQPGDLVNIEVDIMARYIYNYAHRDHRFTIQ